MTFKHQFFILWAILVVISSGGSSANSQEAEFKPCEYVHANGIDLIGLMDITYENVSAANAQRTIPHLVLIAGQFISMPKQSDAFPRDDPENRTRLRLDTANWTHRPHHTVRIGRSSFSVSAQVSTWLTYWPDIEPTKSDPTPWGPSRGLPYKLRRYRVDSGQTAAVQEEQQFPPPHYEKVAAFNRTIFLSTNEAGIGGLITGISPIICYYKLTYSLNDRDFLKENLNTRRWTMIKPIHPYACTQEPAAYIMPSCGFQLDADHGIIVDNRAKMIHRWEFTNRYDYWDTHLAELVIKPGVPFRDFFVCDKASSFVITDDKPAGPSFPSIDWGEKAAKGLGKTAMIALIIVGVLALVGLAVAVLVYSGRFKRMRQSLTGKRSMLGGKTSIKMGKSITSTSGKTVNSKTSSANLKKNDARKAGKSQFNSASSTGKSSRTSASSKTLAAVKSKKLRK